MVWVVVLIEYDYSQKGHSSPEKQESTTLERNIAPFYGLLAPTLQKMFGNNASLSTIWHHFHYDVTKIEEAAIFVQKYRMGVAQSLFELQT